MLEYMDFDAKTLTAFLALAEDRGDRARGDSPPRAERRRDGTCCEYRRNHRSTGLRVTAHHGGSRLRLPLPIPTAGRYGIRIDDGSQTLLSDTMNVGDDSPSTFVALQLPEPNPGVRKR